MLGGAGCLGVLAPSWLPVIGIPAQPHLSNTGVRPKASDPAVSARLGAASLSPGLCFPLCWRLMMAVTMWPQQLPSHSPSLAARLKESRKKGGMVAQGNSRCCHQRRECMLGGQTQHVPLFPLLPAVGGGGGGSKAPGYSKRHAHDGEVWELGSEGPQHVEHPRRPFTHCSVHSAGDWDSLDCCSCPGGFHLLVSFLPV